MGIAGVVPRRARPYPGTKKWHGTSGNSFVAAVEFGDRHREGADRRRLDSPPVAEHFTNTGRRWRAVNLRMYHRERT
ncbi:MAG: hypothetical protein R2712_14610 [Vicinamibacterales bacterium]